MCHICFGFYRLCCSTHFQVKNNAHDIKNQVSHSQNYERPAIFNSNSATRVHFLTLNYFVYYICFLSIKDSGVCVCVWVWGVYVQWHIAVVWGSIFFIVWPFRSLPFGVRRYPARSIPNRTRSLKPTSAACASTGCCG